MPDIAGSIRKLTIEGIPYRVAADSNFSFVPSEYENSMVPTSGTHMRKMVKRVMSVESISLVTNAEEREQLKSFADGLEIVKFTITLVSGDEYRSEGTVNLESHETEENRTSVQLHPNAAWTPFVA